VESERNTNFFKSGGCPDLLIVRRRDHRCERRKKIWFRSGKTSTTLTQDPNIGGYTLYRLKPGPVYETIAQRHMDLIALVNSQDQNMGKPKLMTEARLFKLKKMILKLSTNDVFLDFI